MSGTRHKLIPLSAPDEWRDALRDVDHAFAHTWESCSAASLTTGWETFLYRYEGQDGPVVCPFAERDFRDTVDVVTPYGFSGFAGTGNRDDALDAWHELARARRYVCGYIGLNPVLDHQVGWVREDIDEYSEVFVLNLRQSEEDLFRSLSANRKRAVRAWRRIGSPLIEPRDRLSDFFVEHFAEFMRSRGAAPVYDFSRDTIEHLLALESVVLVGAGDGDGGDPEAVAMFASAPAVGEYLFSCSTPGAEHHSTALIWEGALQLRRLGVPMLNLGGGIRKDDGVAEFKRRFGAQRLPLGRLCEVYDPERFDDLCRAAGRDPADRSGYFPPYRSP